jgi:PEP-CTERM/exosortase A-associated glycosyltransferase
LIAGRVGRRKALPSIYEVRGLWEDSHTGRYGLSASSLRYRGVRALENAAITGVDRVVVICDALRDELIGRGVSRERISVVPNGVDTAKFVPGPPPADLVQRLGLSGKIVAGYIGSFFVYEGLDLLVSAFADLADKAPRLRLLLVGDGEQRAILERLAATAGVRDRVIFTGRVPHSETSAYYRLCDVLVLPRRDTAETRLVTPLKPLEIMAVAKPLLASDIGGHREMIDDGRTGILFKAGDAQDLEARLLTLTSNLELMSRLGENGLEWVRRERDWNSLVNLYKDIYDELTRRSRPRGRL